jgi:hypothetical protein
VKFHFEVTGDVGSVSPVPTIRFTFTIEAENRERDILWAGFFVGRQFQDKEPFWNLRFAVRAE